MTIATLQTRDRIVALMDELDPVVMYEELRVLGVKGTTKRAAVELAKKLRYEREVFANSRPHLLRKEIDSVLSGGLKSTSYESKVSGTKDPPVPLWDRVDRDALKDWKSYERGYADMLAALEEAVTIQRNIFAIRPTLDRLANEEATT
jgi:hypothetical protein